MSWLRIDDAFAEHAKVYALSDRAFRLHVAALCYCARNLTDGLIDERGLRVISITAKVKKASIFVAELVAMGLWKVVPKGHQVRSYLEYNPSASDVKEARRKAAERKARARENGGSHGGSHGGTDAVTDGVSHASPPHPVPSKGSSDPLEDRESGTVVDLKTEVREVYDHWRDKCGKSDARYNSVAPERAKKIRARLSDGFPVADLKRAIDAVAADPWPDRKKHNDITVIFRSREKVDEWLDRSTEGGSDEFAAYRF